MSEISFTELAQFQPKQKQAWYALMNEICKYLLYGGAAFGGKSYFLRWAAIGLGMYYFSRYGIRNVPIGLFSEDYPTLKDRQVIKMKNEIPSFLGKLQETRDEGYSFVAAPRYGSFIILLRNLDDPSKYSSTEFAAILVEELTKNSRTTFDDLRFRLRYPGIADPKFVGATNPGGVGHGFVKQLWVKPDPLKLDVEQERFFFVPALYSDNKFTTEGYVKQLDSLPLDKRKAYKEGNWDMFAGQYFNEWKENLHVCNPFIPNKSNVIVGGMDWGRTAPFAFHLAEVQKVKTIEGLTFYRTKVFCEVYGVEKTPKEWADEIHKQLEFFKLKVDDISWIQGDPAMFTKGNDNSLSIADQFNREKIRMRPASNDRIGGWENLHRWLTIAPDGLPYIQVASNCINLIRTLPELVHDDNKIEDVDTTGEDHSPDALRYMLKALKWIDGITGGVGRTEGTTQKKFTAQIDPETGKQVSIDTNLFSQPKKRLYYK